MNNVEKLLKSLKNLALTVECEPKGSPNIMEAVKSAYDTIKEVQEEEGPTDCTCNPPVQCEICFIDSFNGV